MCRFKLPFSGTGDTLVSRAKAAIGRAGGAFTGNDANGSFQVKTPLGPVSGDYAIFDQEISIAVTKKPFLLSCSRIQNELSKVLR